MPLAGISDVVRTAPAGRRVLAPLVLVLSFGTPVFAAGHDSEHLNDIDVRDIQSVVKNVWPGVIVSMNGFRNSCNCEESPSCTAQIDIVAYENGKSRMIVVSKIGGFWKIGRYQDWLLRVATLEARRPLTAEDQRKLAALNAERPECPRQYDAGYGAELQNALIAARIPFQRNDRGFVHYDEKYDSQVAAIRKEIDRKLYTGVSMRIQDMVTRECFKSLLSARRLEYRIQRRPDGEWLRWYPVDALQEREVESAVEQRVEDARRRGVAPDCRETSVQP